MLKLNQNKLRQFQINLVGMTPVELYNLAVKGNQRALKALHEDYNRGFNEMIRSRRR